MNITQSDFLTAALIMTVSGGFIALIIGTITLLSIKSKRKEGMKHGSK